MRLLPRHKGRRFRLPHHYPYQFITVQFVGPLHVLALDEFGRPILFDRDDRNRAWIPLGPSPHPHPHRRKNDFKRI